MAVHPHILELERQVLSDPASIAFGQLAEEYRRVGRLDDAVRVCRVGLERYPDFPSVRLTLARALIALGHRSDAETELARVAAEDPDHLAARAAQNELRRLRGETPSVRPINDDARRDGVAVDELERWLANIAADRARRATHADGAIARGPD